MSTESKELAAKASGFDSKKAFDLLLNNALYILMIIAVIVIQVINPNFPQAQFPRQHSLSQTAAYLPLALGIAGCIVLTGTDLSAGRCVGLTACISASLLQAVTTSNKMWPEIGTLPIPVVILIAMGIGAAVGVFNGFFIGQVQAASLHRHPGHPADPVLLPAAVRQDGQQRRHGHLRSGQEL